MAFVVRSIKKPTYIPPPENILGPGQYAADEEKKLRQHIVPFNATSPQRGVTTDRKRKPILGPGQYNPENQEVQKQQIYNGVFKSKNDRFKKPLPSYNLGPGEYGGVDFPSKGNASGQQIQVNRVQQHVISTLMAINKYQSIPSIPSRCHVLGYAENEQNDIQLNKNPIEVYTGVGMDKIGPNHYSTKNLKIPRGANWSKLKEEKMKSVNQNIPGCGTYEVQDQPQPLYKLKQSCGFASRTIRSADPRNRSAQSRRGSKVSKPTTAADGSDSEYEYFDDYAPGPGHYNDQKPTKIAAEKKLQHQFFGTSQQRFPASNGPNLLGPGDYNAKLPIKPLNMKNPPFTIPRHRVEGNEKEFLGPGYYNEKIGMQQSLLKKAKKCVSGNFMTNQQRFPHNRAEEAMQLVGPGTYLGQHTYVQPEVAGDALAPTQAVFKSGLKQIPDIKIKKEPPVGSYDVEVFDIKNKFIQYIEEEDDLKIYKPGFLCGDARFEYQKNKKISTPKKSPPKEEEPQVREQGVPFNTKADRFHPLQGESRKFDKKPPLGTYETNKNLWNKKTFNILFTDI